MPQYGPRPLPPHAPPLPKQPQGIPWPTREWPRDCPKTSGDPSESMAVIEAFFDPREETRLGTTHALLVVQQGSLVAERYGPGGEASKPLSSWSMAKSILHAWVGILVGEGRLQWDSPAPIPEWQAPEDPRRAITLDQLLRMSSGLEFNEIYEDHSGSDAIEMLFRGGREDVAHYAAAKPLMAAPGTLWNYSSGTSNIIARLSQSAVQLTGDAFIASLRERLLDPIGAKSFTPQVDGRGTWIASSFASCTAQDFARFGLLCLRDGCWEETRILPPGWIDYARTPTAYSGGEYGAHFWISTDGSGVFSCNGFRSQYIVIVPERDLIVVRLGDSESDQKGALLTALQQLTQLYPLLDEAQP
ncbi:MAG: serine hydrolase [Myxococcota bacterium]|nr:serine hydrolase [Myxococcota bacterium]